MRILPIANDNRYYVSLGDAQSRGTAYDPGAASKFFARLAALESGWKMIPLATEGATGATVRYVQLPRLREMAITPSLITLTLGAGDLSRLAFGYGKAVCKELNAHVAVLFDTLRESAPGCVILLSALYDPMDGIDPVLATGVARFNGALRAIAASYSATVADTDALFAGHGALVGDPLSQDDFAAPSGLYLCAGADLTPVPNRDGGMVLADALFAVYQATVPGR